MNIEAPNVSGYVAEAAAQTRSEDEARAQRMAAATAQKAFFTVVQTASELTAEGLPPGKTVAEAIARATARKEYLWSQDIDEEGRIDQLLGYCIKLYGGNAHAGQLLASAAIWS